MHRGGCCASNAVLMRLALLILLLVAGAGKAAAQPAEKPALPAEKQKEEDLKPSDSHKRIELNLLGKTDTDAGESRRNENIQFNLVDNNALKELNVRLGTTATIVREFSPGNNYFGAEFGNPQAQAFQMAAPLKAGTHGTVYASHLNSICSARSSLLAADPPELPNRTDINPRALNRNSPQEIDNNNAGIRMDQDLSSRDRVAAQFQFASQNVDAFQLVAGQNPDTTTRSQKIRMNWSREWTSATVTDFSLGFDRLVSFLRPEENAVGPQVSISGLDTLGPQGSIPIDRA